MEPPCGHDEAECVIGTFWKCAVCERTPEPPDFDDDETSFEWDGIRINLSLDPDFDDDDDWAWRPI